MQWDWVKQDPDSNILTIKYVIFNHLDTERICFYMFPQFSPLFLSINISSINLRLFIFPILFFTYLIASKLINSFFVLEFYEGIVKKKWNSNHAYELLMVNLSDQITLDLFISLKSIVYSSVIKWVFSETW